MLLGEARTGSSSKRADGSPKQGTLRFGPFDIGGVCHFGIDAASVLRAPIHPARGGAFATQLWHPSVRYRNRYRIHFKGSSLPRRPCLPAGWPRPAAGPPLGMPWRQPRRAQPPGTRRRRRRTSQGCRRGSR